VGQSNCTGNPTYGPSKITIRNIGTLPFVVTKDWVIDKTTGAEFKMDAASASRLPYTLFVPGDVDHPRHDSINLYFCYTPINLGKDSTIINWATDIPSPYTNQVKSWSYLKGRGIKPGIIWDRSDEIYRLDSSILDTPITRRVYLLATATAVIHMDRVYFSGPDAAEFTLSNNQLNQNPLEGFDMRPGDTIWVEYTFQTDITKPYPARYADRHAKLEATYFTDAVRSNRDTTRIDITVTYNKPLAINEQRISTEKIKAYIYSHQLIVELPDDNNNYFDCSLYDLLGRKVTEWSKQNILTEGNIMALPLPKISSGAYVLRLRSESGHQASALVMVEN